MAALVRQDGLDDCGLVDDIGVTSGYLGRGSGSVEITFFALVQFVTDSLTAVSVFVTFRPEGVFSARKMYSKVPSTRKPASRS